MHRRAFLASTAAVALGSTAVFMGRRPAAARNENAKFEITLTEEEWRERLTPEQYHILRDHGTERPFSSPLDDEERAGVFHCAGCDQELYLSSTKFDSRTGWPSFWDDIKGKVGTSVDYKLIFPRTEVHCSRCGGHLGHVFKDGPAPTGDRHCLNGLSLTFKPSEEEEATKQT